MVPLEISWRLDRSEMDGAGVPLISIIIPCYNQAHFLCEAIESALGQSYANFEIVVVDDGSTDNSEEVGGQYSGVHCIRQDHQGLAAARNTGLRHCRGEYLVFLDADDRLLPEALKVGVEVLKMHPDCAFVAGHYRVIEANGGLREMPPHRVAGEHYAELLRRNYIAMHATVMYRREVFASVGSFNTSLRACEDYELYLRIARQWPIHCHAQVVAEYRQHGGNMTQNPALMLECALTVLRSQWPQVQGNPRHEEAYRAGMRFWQGYYGAQSAGQKDQLAVLEVLNVTLCEMPTEQLLGRNLEVPQIGNQSAGQVLELAGWVVGRCAPPVAIEVIAGGRLLRREAIDVRRVDVAAHYPEVVGAEKSGFHTWVAIAGIGDQDLLVQAVLRDHIRLPLARVHARRRWHAARDGSATPLVSVIIPCYNQGYFLADAIKSVLAQSYAHFEIVVVDDGSTDNTSEVAASYPGVRCVRQDNQGLAPARNTGLRQSRGEYVVFLDADDRLLPDALEVGLAACEAHPDCALVAGYYRLSGVEGGLLEELPQYPVTGHHYAELLRRNFIRVPATVMYRRAVFASIGDFDSAVSPCADYDIYLRIARQFPIYCHEHIVAEYRQHAANMTRNPALMLKSVLHVLQSQWKEVRRNEADKKAYQIGRRAWQDYYGEQLVTNVRDKFKDHQWQQALCGIITLVCHFPRGVASLLFPQPFYTRRVEEILRSALPSNAKIIVVGDNHRKLLKLHGFQVSELPFSENRDKPDPNPAYTTEVIRRLENLRAQGGEFLLVPHTAFWWLQQYRELPMHLEVHYRRVWSDQRCIIYQLSELKPGQPLTGLQDLLVCPACKGELHFSTRMIRCTSCKSEFRQFRNDCINLLPEHCLANEPTRWNDRQQEMETWYQDLMANPQQAHDCFVHDYAPFAPILATLSGKILDLGGGIGLVRHYLSPGTEYVVIDPSLSWLGTEWLSLADRFPCLRTQPSFVRGVGECLPFPAQTFDAVLACWSLNHARNPQEVFREVCHVLRSGGRFLIILEDMPADKIALDQALHLSDITPEREHPGSAQTFTCCNDSDAPLQSDHIRILESDIEVLDLRKFRGRTTILDWAIPRV